jgi:DNA-binding transcriptional MocR family regulator
MPQVAAGAAPLFERLAATLESDIGSGRLAPGVRLPPQRDLAHSLGIGVGTVTKAYAEAERRGLTRARVGQGTFVAGPGAAPDDAPTRRTLDLSVNLPPSAAAEAAMFKLWPALRERPEFSLLGGYAGVDAPERLRRSVVRWLDESAQLGDVPRPDPVLCNGAMQALLLATRAVSRPGDVVLCEALTFPVYKAIAEGLGVKLVGIELDAEGACPEALRRAARETGARAVMLIPTLNSPTARTCSLARRKALVAAARKDDLTIIEDDVYGCYAHGGAPAPALAALAPERTFYVGSASKSLLPGLRAGWIVPPPARRDDLLNLVRTLGAAPSLIGHLAFAALVETGEAARLLGTIRAEAKARTELALSMLGKAVEAPSTPQSLHLWLPLPGERAEQVVRLALAEGVRLSPPGSHAVASEAPTGVRICVGGPRSRAELQTALAVVAGALSKHGNDGYESVI